MEKILELIATYIDPAMLVIVPILVLVGAKIKKSKIKDKYIPFAIICTGMVLGAGYAFLTDVLTWYAGAFQGLLIAGLETLGYNIYKQSQKEE